MRHPIRWMGAAALVSAMLAGTAWGDSRYLDQVQQYNQKISEMRAADTDGTVAGELDKAAAWLQQAQSQIAEEEYEVAERLLRRTVVQLDYAKALLDVAAINSQAEAKEAEAAEMEGRLSELQTTVQDMRQREAELRAKVDALKARQGGMP